MRKKMNENFGSDFKLIFVSLPGIYFILKPDFKVLAVSNQYLVNTFEKHENIVALNFFDVLKKNGNSSEDDGVIQLKLSLKNVLKNNSPDYMSIQKFKIRKSPSDNNNFLEKYWRIINSPVCNKKNEIIYIILKIDDVTEIMKLKANNVEDNKDFLKLRYQNGQKEKIQRSQRVESIGQLTGGVSHDINNMLTIINLNCDIILNSSQAVSTIVRKQCEQIKKTCKHAARLIQQILRFTKKQAANAKVININSSISDIEKMLLRLLGENISLELNLNLEVGNILADPVQIEQIILNLVINARDAISDIGKITIETSNVLIEKDSTFGSHGINQGKYVLLSVGDDGIGMSPETQARIFEPFFSTKEDKGTGLGLATVHTIVAHYHGTIDVKSELGKGTTFYIYFPFTELKEDTVSLDLEQQTSLQGNESLLVVEDTEELRDIMAVSLKNYGYKVVTAKNSLEAIALIQKDQHKFQLIITDVIMPKMGGKIMAEKMKEIFPKLKILYLSGHSEDILALNGISKDSPFFLEKPFSLTALLSKVKNILQY